MYDRQDIAQTDLGYFLVFVTDDEREMLARYYTAVFKDDVAHDFEREKKLVAQVNAEQQFGRSMLHPGAFRTEYFEDSVALGSRLKETEGFTSPCDFT